MTLYVSVWVFVPLALQGVEAIILLAWVLDFIVTDATRDLPYLAGVEGVDGDGEVDGVEDDDEDS